VSIESRLTRLRALAERVERLPAAPRRQWMLSEARARVVDVETGEAPRGMRPLAADAPLWAEDWQADASPAAQAGDGDAKSRPWRFGLRG
jgi:hypothetical protein